MFTDITATFQRNVLVNYTIDVQGKSITQGVTFSHSGFWDWIKENNITEFCFRPACQSDEQLMTKRINKVVKCGFNVSDSGQQHHYKKAVAKPAFKLVNADDCEYNKFVDSSNMQVAQQFFEYYSYRLSGAYLYQNIHGYVIQFIAKSDTYPAGSACSPWRMDKEDFAFLSSLSDKIRWCEMSMGKFSVGFPTYPPNNI